MQNVITPVKATRPIAEMRHVITVNTYVLLRIIQFQKLRTGHSAQKKVSVEFSGIDETCV